MTEPRRPKDWSVVSNPVKELCAVPHMTAARVFAIIDQDRGAQNYSGEKNSLNQQAAELLGWRKLPSGTPPYRLAVVGGRYTAIPSHISNEMIAVHVAEAVDEEVDAIVDLGCGYGRLLFALRDVLEHKYPNIKYFGGELSESGLETGRAVAALEPGRASVTFHSFDHLNPDLSFLKGCKNAIFYTCHTLEQIHRIGPEWFRTVRDAVPKMRCFHSEPVGWQLDLDVVKSIEDGTFEPRYPPGFRLGARVDEVYSAGTPVRLKWNFNMMRVILTMAKHGELNIDYMEPNACGDQNYNPSTLVFWRPPGQAKTA